MIGFVKVFSISGCLLTYLDFLDLEEEISKPLSEERYQDPFERQKPSVFEKAWNTAIEQASKVETSVPEPQDQEKVFKDRFQQADTPVKSYSTETHTSTHIIRNSDGSVHKETITTEKLSDGSTKTTRIVNTTPAGGDAQQSRTETTVNTTPPTVSSAVEDKAWKLPRDEDKSTKVEMDEKKGNDGQKSWAWWFWSRK
jgi:hypothetical protein